MLPEFDSVRCVGCMQCASACPMGVIGKGENGRPAVLPRRRCIGCMHCCSICPRKAIRFEGLSEEQLYRSAPESPVEKLIVSRRSVRHFQPDPPPEALIRHALDLAEYAPSGKNFHKTQWTVLYGKAAADHICDFALEICRKTGEAPELPKLYAKGTNLLTCGAPCVIIGWSPDDCLNPVNDTIVAMTTLELLLQSSGISTCWGGYLNQLSAHHASLRAELGIPEGCNMRCALMVGYPNRESYRNIPYRPKASIRWFSE